MTAVITVLPILFAIVATVLAFIFIVPEKKRPQLNKIGQLLHDVVNFKFLIVEKILQALYILSTAYTILTGFFMLFYVEPGYEGVYYSRDPQWYGGYGLLIMVLGPIALRLAFELLMMAVLLIKNVIQINNKLKNANEDAPEGTNPFAAPVMPSAPAAPVAPVAPVVPEAPAAPAAPAATVFCPRCGATIKGGHFCPCCGAQV